MNYCFNIQIPDLLWLSENHHQKQETIQYLTQLTYSDYWMMPVWRHVTVSLSINVQYPDVHVSVGLCWCVQCSWLLTADTAGLGRPPPRLGGGRADGQKAGPLDQPLSGPWQLWPGPRMWARGRYYLDKNPRTFPWCCIMHGIFRAN